MTFSPAVRKVLLTAHVTASVGWLGAVAAFLALALVGLRGGDALMVRGAYLGMDVIGWAIIVPACFLSLITGIVQGLGTPWGLFRHYWVVAKLAITVLSTVILMIHMQPISMMASIAAASVIADGDHQNVRLQLVVDAGAALVALLAATVLSVVKPRGLTRHGHRKEMKDSRFQLLSPWLPT